jgi:peptidyl-dipeptidase A
MPRGMKRLSVFVLALVAIGCSKNTRDSAPGTPEEEAVQWIATTDTELKALWTESSLAAWEQETNITDENEAKASAAHEKVMAYTAQAIRETPRFAELKLPDLPARQLHLLKSGSSLPGPLDDAHRKELAEISTKLSSMYGKGKHCKTVDGAEKCLELGDLEDILRESRDPAAILDAWTGWRTVSPPMRPLYERFVELGNEGARDIGYDDLSVLWRSRYDMTPAEVDAEVERLWQQVKPLYEQLHCYARDRLNKKYPGVVEAEGAVPAHVFGNMWAQDWANIYDVMEPYPGKAELDVTAALVKKGYTPKQVIELGEKFFTSLGLMELPDTFWERSMIEKPDGRDVVCHASAWDLTFSGDVRVKMCTKVNEEDVITAHHELGHIYYFLYYKDLPVLFQDGAHDGFHEAIGDAIALSVNPSYYKDRGILDEVPTDQEGLINVQMKRALDKVAFLPFALVIDKWRWGVFEGKTKPADYNAAWWKLRTDYQGIAPPVARDESSFDPGAKYHIPGNTPYLRYFLSFVLQFQLHKSMCESAGHTGPLHECSIYGSEEAGAKLRALLEKGSTQPWQDTMEQATGTRQMDASALLEYFAPLDAWLKEQNKDKTCGW